MIAGGGGFPVTNVLGPLGMGTSLLGLIRRGPSITDALKKNGLTAFNVGDYAKANNMNFMDALKLMATPGWNPNANTPSLGGGGSTPAPQIPNGSANIPVQGGDDGFDWSKWLPFLVGAGSNIAGGILEGRAQGQYNDRLDKRAELMDKLARDEMARREYYATIILPNLMRGQGYGIPKIQQTMAARPSNNAGGF